MIEYLNRLFGRRHSSATAKERLRLVLMSDHLSLAPEMVEAMKGDLVDVISKYVEVDRSKIEVSFEQQDAALAMLANIPILSVNRDAGRKAEPPPLERRPAAVTKPSSKRRRKKGSAAPAAGKPAAAT